MQLCEAESVDAIASASGIALDSAHELGLKMARLWVARVDEQAQDPDAFLLVWDAADELHIIAVAVRPDLRRRGLGRALIGTLIAEARQQNKRLILLEVRRSNRAALALYRSFGFSVSRLRRGYYTAPEEDGIEMLAVFDAQGHIQRMPDEITGLEV